MGRDRAINWLDSTRRSLRASVPEAAECADPVAERLSALMLERLSQDLAAELAELLPEQESADQRFHALRSPQQDRSIGLATFLELSHHLLGLTDLLDQPQYAEALNGEEAYGELCLRVVEAFLWAFAQELPPELKHRIAEQLPSDLRCRMNLYSGYAAEDKVA